MYTSVCPFSFHKYFCSFPHGFPFPSKANIICIIVTTGKCTESHRHITLLHSANALRTFEDILLPASHHPPTVPDHTAMRIHVRTTDNAINCFLNIVSEGIRSLFFSLREFWQTANYQKTCLILIRFKSYMQERNRTLDRQVN